MMHFKSFRSLFGLLSTALALATGSAHAQNNLTVVCYHDIVDVAGPKDDPDAVTLGALTKEIQWLQRSNYHFVTLEEVLQARQSGSALADKSVLLTFDDGYRSFYTHAYPMLQMLNVPATLAVVGSWVQPDAKGQVMVDGVVTPAQRFMTQEQLKEVSDSGLVELTSHTFALHKSVVANAMGSRIPAVIARIYDARTGQTEPETTYEKRLSDDLQKNAEFLEHLTGKRPRAVVWPYGRYNGAALRAAKASGAQVTFTLDELGTDWTTSQDTLGRKYIEGKPTLRTFADFIERKPESGDAIRHVAVNMDAFVADGKGLASPAEVEDRLSRFLDEVTSSNVTAVLVNPFSDECKAFYPQSQHPVVRDVLSRVVWQLRSRAHVQVYLDIDVAGCLNAGLARPELLGLLSTTSFDGLVMRTDPQSQGFARELADVFHQEMPNRPVASNVDFTNRTLMFQELNACRLPSEDNLKSLVVNKVWVELHAEGCSLPDAVHRLRDAGVRNWGAQVRSPSLTVPLVLRTPATGN